MKIIDEKGRLFGKINVIDFLVILFFIFLVPIFYYTYRIVYQKPKQETLRQFEMDCLFIKLNPEIAEIISVGDKELDKNGKPIGEVVKVGKISPYVYEFEIGTAENLTKEDPILKQISVKLKIRAEQRENSIYYKDKRILNNRTIEFTTNKYQTEALCLFKKEDKSIMADIGKAKIEIKLANTEERLNTLEKNIERLNTLEKSVDSLLHPQENK